MHELTLLSLFVTKLGNPNSLVPPGGGPAAPAFFQDRELGAPNNCLPPVDPTLGFFSRRHIRVG